MKPKVSFVVTNYNGRKFLKECFDSIFSQTFEDFEVILVDDSSTDDSVEFVKKQYPKVRVCVNEKNLGNDEACNKGIDYSIGEYIALLDNDVKFGNNWLCELMKIMQSSETIGAVGSTVHDIPKLEMYKEYPSRHTQLSIFNYLIYDDSNGKEKVIVSFYNGAGATLYRRKLLKKPYFDSLYAVYGEDIALCWKLRLQGYQVKVATKVITLHYGGGTIKLAPDVLMHSEKNRLLNPLLFYETLTLVKLFPLFCISLVLHNTYCWYRITLNLKSYFLLLSKCREIFNKRKLFQKNRKVGDKEIFRYMTYKLYDEKQIRSGFKFIIKLLNKFTFAYCLLFNIRTMEFYRPFDCRWKPHP